MIDTALILLKGELENFIHKDKKDNSIHVDLRNIAMFERGQEDELSDKIIISLVNIEEESTLKNMRNVSTISGKKEYISPPVNLNLYLLMISNLKIKNDEGLQENSYFKSLSGLSYIIEFFQHRNTFSIHNSPSFQTKERLEDSEINEMKLFMDLYTLTFEQINHLWGSLGGRQLPFVMYKARLVSIQHKSVRKVAPLIEEIEINVSKKEDV
jgi:Pvc16 N-terminal domain